MGYTRVSGIYRIVCMATSKAYVGSAVSIKGRWASHRSNLRRGRHTNRHLQNAWTKYGEEQFLFEIVETCTVEALIETEQRWIDILDAANPANGMNNMAVASNTLGFRHSEQTKKRLSEIAAARDPGYYERIAEKTRGKPSNSKGMRGHRLTAEQRAAISRWMKGRKPWNVGIPMAEEVKAKVSATLLRDGKRRTIPDECVTKVRDLRERGLIYKDIAAASGISLAQAHRFSKDIEVSPRRGLKKGVAKP